MTLHTDIPTRGQVSRLFASVHPASISIYLPTEPTSNGQAERIALKNLVSEATDQLEDAGTPKRDIAALEAHFDDLAQDPDFWRFQARTLAIFATPESLVSHRLPNRLVEMVAVADRFHLKPLLRSITFPQVALVLTLSQKSARLLEVLPEGSPNDVDLDLPQGVEDAARIVHVEDRAPRGKTQSSMVETSHLRIYARSMHGWSRFGFGDGDGVISLHLDLGTEAHEGLGEVVGEGVVVVDEEDPAAHRPASANSRAWRRMALLARTSRYSFSATLSATIPAPA